MKILFKILIIAIVLFMFSFTNVQALDIFLTNRNDTNNENISEQNIINVENEVYENISTDERDKDITVETNPSPTVTTTVTSNNTLSLSDIIDIILISVCIVLIFLAIAILIRCK